MSLWSLKKSDHRLKRNFLKGFAGDQINLLMAAAAFNFRKWMREVLYCAEKYHVHTIVPVCKTETTVLLSAWNEYFRVDSTMKKLFAKRLLMRSGVP